MNFSVFFLLTFLIVCAIAVALTKDPFKAVLIQMGFSSNISMLILNTC